MRHGIEARELTASDRVTLQTRVQIMKINGESEQRIAAYAKAFRSEFKKDIPLIGREFCNMLGRMGYLITLTFVAVHVWIR